MIAVTPPLVLALLILAGLVPMPLKVAFLTLALNR